MLSIRDIFRTKKKMKQLPPRRINPIVTAFEEYIHNEIPTRLINTATLQFVTRKDVFHLFHGEIASITDDHIQERIRSCQSDPLATYQPQRETVIRHIIQEIVRYVTLSHRWDEYVGEPTYQDVMHGKQHMVIRFKKLAQFCKTSNSLGYKLAWVDTCCIDKTNATELSEAIHGMYKWYANAYLCIVHLAESTSYADWVEESWFRRGWTLQELLAPKRIKFYDKSWRPFGSSGIEDDRKFADILPPLEKATGISKAVLTADNSWGIQGCTFWEIMSWASRRQTTRIEDRAYCLIGLFHVSLTITYGEGQRAFTRLVEAIATRQPSWHIFTWCGQPSVDHFVLPPSPASYPRFEASMARRTGVQEFTITPYTFSLRSLPPVPMELSAVVDPDEPRKPFIVHLKPCSDNTLSSRFGNLVVECGATRLNTIRSARQLSACLLNHHRTRHRERGELMVGSDYICFLLYSEDEAEDEMAWMKLSTDNPLRISCVGLPDKSGKSTVDQGVDSDHMQETFTLPLVTTVIRSPPSR